MLLTGPFAMLSMPSFDFHLPPCTEGFLIHLSPLWQLPHWQLPMFPSVAQFPCILYLRQHFQQMSSMWTRGIVNVFFFFLIFISYFFILYFLFIYLFFFNCCSDHHPILLKFCQLVLQVQVFLKELLQLLWSVKINSNSDNKLSH